MCVTPLTRVTTERDHCLLLDVSVFYNVYITLIILKRLKTILKLFLSHSSVE